jgi:hypothetical protein
LLLADVRLVAAAGGLRLGTLKRVPKFPSDVAHGSGMLPALESAGSDANKLEAKDTLATDAARMLADFVEGFSNDVVHGFDSG